MLDQPKQPAEFNPALSPLFGAYDVLGATSPHDLYKKYVEVEQVHFKNGTWDYNNPNLLFNKVKIFIETVGLENLAGEEEEWARELLWFWYHHAISMAFGRDRKMAQEFASKALEIQGSEHPNQITRLLYHLVHDDVSGAELWYVHMNEGADKLVARELIDEYNTHFTTS